MIGHADDGLIADFEIIGCDDDTGVGELFHFAAEMPEIHDHAVSHDVYDLGTQDARREQIEDKFPSVVDNGVARIVSALIAAYDIAFFGEKIDHAAFSFVAPVNSDNSCKHKFISPIDFYCPPKKSTNYYSTVSLVCKDGFEKNLKNCEKYAFGSCPVLTYRGKYDKLYKETVIYAA